MTNLSKCLPPMAGLFLAAACSAAGNYELDEVTPLELETEQTAVKLGSLNQPILNGSRPSLGDRHTNGVVRYDLLRDGDVVPVCTGQIVSATAILTAAHCPRSSQMALPVDTTEGQFEIRVERQLPDGQWECLHEGCSATATFTIPASYAGRVENSEWIGDTTFNDIAIIQFEERDRFTTLTEQDAANLLLSSTDPLAGTTHAFGYEAPLRELRYGQLDTNYVELGGELQYLYESPEPQAPRLSGGDSGGPLKSDRWLGGRDGTVIGVASKGGVSTSHWAPVAPHIDFLRAVIEDGTSFCSQEQHGDVAVLSCW